MCMFNVGADMNQGIFKNMCQRLEGAFTRHPVTLTETSAVCMEGLADVLGGDEYPLSKYNCNFNGLTWQSLESKSIDKEARDDEISGEVYALHARYQYEDGVLNSVTMSPEYPDHTHGDALKTDVSPSQLAGPGTLSVHIRIESQSSSITYGGCQLSWYTAHDDLNPTGLSFVWK